MARNKKKRVHGKGQTPASSGRAASSPQWIEDIPHPADEDGTISTAPSLPLSGRDGVALAPLVLTVAQVCAFLNVSRTTLHRLEKAGKLPGRVKLGGQVRYHREIIEKWVLERVKDEASQETEHSA